MAGCWLVPGCLTTADWGRAKLCWVPGRAAPRPARPALSSVIMRGPGHLSHTVRVTHYVDTFWPAWIMFHPWSNAAQKTRSHFLLWRGVAITEANSPLPSLSLFLQNNSFHVSNFQITSVTFQISRGENIFSKMESIDRWEEGHLPCDHQAHSGDGDEINSFIIQRTFKI